MSHITIIISKRTAAPTGQTDSEKISAAEVTYVPPDSASESEIAQEVKRLVRQVRSLGTGPTEE